MKNFFKVLLAVVCGFVVFAVLSIFVMVGIVGSLSSTPEVSLKNNTVLKIHLNGVLEERSSEDAFSFMKGMTDVLALGLDDVLDAVEKARTREEVQGIYLQCDAFQAAPASLEELRSALLKFKESGKWIVAYGNSYTQGCYELASVADVVYMNPQGMLEIRGIALRTMMMKGLLDNLGVKMQVVKVGTYKSAVEPYILEHISEANREQLKSMGNSIWGQYVANVSTARGCEMATLDEYANNGLMWEDATKAVECGLIDSLVYESAMDNLLKARFECDKKDVHVLTLKEMKAVADKTAYQKDKVAVVYAVGGIDTNSTGEEGIDSKKLTKQLLDLVDEENVKAVVLRVNSPGGSAFGSEQIWEAIGRLRAVKPVIVSMGDYAASGGYYISCQADSIIAEPTTLTGSIGIFGIIPSFENLTKKVGVGMDVVATHELGDMGNTFRSMNSSELNLMQNYVNRGYELFVKRCADGRGMTTDEIKAIAEGRVWTGEQALKIGLVDALGTLDDAVKIAAEKVGLEQYNIVRYPEKKDLMTQLLEEVNGVESRLMLKLLGEKGRTIQEVTNLTKEPSIQARLPYYLTIE